jgi:simple sugar transport system permease protein
MRELLLSAPGRLVVGSLTILLLTGAFFLAIGRNPVELVGLIARSALGDGYAITESLVRATPILLCALATAVPARLGLITVGAEGQLYFGALLGTGFVLTNLESTGIPPYVGMIAIAMVAGAVWALLPALLRSHLGVNETISTLLVNYVAALLVTWVVYGPWKSAANLGWPATVDFPESFKPLTYFDSRVHTGLWIAIVLAVVLHGVFACTRWGLALEVLRSNPRAGVAAGLRWQRNVLLTMALGGMLAGLAGILETAAIQGRLQANLSAGAGLSGFLVAWLARNHCLRIIPMSLLVGALLASGDGVQMFANLPSSIALVVQGLLFVAVLLVGGVANRLRVRRG